jgi:Zn-dependent protease with chaperone function
VDRDVVLAGLLIITVGLTLLAVAPWPRPITPRRNAREWELAAWRALWWPSVPVVAVISILIGWAIVEPAISDDHLPFSAVVLSALFLGMWLRVMIRAVRALRSRTPVVAGTVGLWRARVVFSDDLIARLDPHALDAAEAHETAHVRHRDPLRIWLAQLITDLQWPWPAAMRRFERWRHVLELARDEEARLSGADGADLAAAILVAAKLQMSPAPGASLIEDSIGLQERINRLLAPVSGEDVQPRSHTAIALFSVSVAGVPSGVWFGERFVEAIVKCL